jgi:hypothetical protein
MQQAATTRQHEITDVALDHVLDAGVRAISRAPLSHGEVTADDRRRHALAHERQGAAGAPWVRPADRLQDARHPLFALGRAGTHHPARSACLSDAIATIGTSVGEGPDEPCASPRLASEHQMTIGVRHELECYGSG